MKCAVYSGKKSANFPISFLWFLYVGIFFYDFIICFDTNNVVACLSRLCNKHLATKVIVKLITNRLNLLQVCKVIALN